MYEVELLLKQVLHAARPWAVRLHAVVSPDITFRWDCFDSNRSQNLSKTYVTKRIVQP